MTDTFGTWTNCIKTSAAALMVGVLSYYRLTFDPEGTPNEVLWALLIGTVSWGTIAIVGFLVNWVWRVPYEQWAVTEVSLADAHQRIADLTRPPPAPPPEPADIISAKQAIANFVATPLAQADDAVREAVRLSAYNFKDAWSDHPAGKLGWAGILSSHRPPELIPMLSDPARLRGVPLDAAQEALLKALVEYRVRVHKLHEVVSGLIKYDRLRDSSGFFKAVQSWRSLHDTVISKFEKLRRTAQFDRLREAKIESYLADPKFDVAVFDPIMSGKTDGE